MRCGASQRLGRPGSRGDACHWGSPTIIDPCLAVWRHHISLDNGISIFDSCDSTPIHVFLLSPIKECRKETIHCHLTHEEFILPPDSGVDLSIAPSQTGPARTRCIPSRGEKGRNAYHEDRIVQGTLRGYEGQEIVSFWILFKRIPPSTCTCGRDEVVGLFDIEWGSRLYGELLRSRDVGQGISISQPV